MITLAIISLVLALGLVAAAIMDDNDCGVVLIAMYLVVNLVISILLIFRGLKWNQY